MDAGKVKLMKRKILLYTFLVLLVTQVTAQQTSQYKYHIFDNYLLNPAYVGMYDYYPVMIGRDQRFIGLSESTPQTYFLSLHSRVGEGYVFAKDGKINKFFEDFGSMALGLQLFQFSYGPSRETNIGVTYGYHLDLDQNYKRKNQRKLVLAFTPRLKRLGFNYNDLQLQGSELGTNDNTDFYDPVLGDMDHLRAWMFTADVGALYKSIHGEFGVAALDLVQSKNKLESELLQLNDTVSYSSFDSLYPAKFVGDFRLTFMQMYSSGPLDVDFIPSVAAIYAPKTKDAEFYVDLMLEGTLKQHIAGVRSEVVLIGQLGLNIYHSRIYEPATYLQPYLTLDFKNFTVKYAQTINIDSDLVATPGVSSGHQVSVLFKISRDRVVRGKSKQGTSWHD